MVSVCPLLSPGASCSASTQTLNLGLIGRLFFHWATTTGQFKYLFFPWKMKEAFGEKTLSIFVAPNKKMFMEKSCHLGRSLSKVAFLSIFSKLFNQTWKATGAKTFSKLSLDTKSRGRMRHGETPFSSITFRRVTLIGITFSWMRHNRSVNDNL